MGSIKMQRLLSRVGALGVGLATIGATINSTLYNGNVLIVPAMV